MGLWLLTIVEPIVIKLLEHIIEDSDFWSACEKLLKSVFNLIIAAKHPNTVLTSVANHGLTVLAQIEADQAAKTQIGTNTADGGGG